MPKIEHLALWCQELETMRDFYLHYFDGTSGTLYHNPKKEFYSYFLTFEDGARLELMRRAYITNSPSGVHLGWAHLAFSVGSKKQVNELTDRLKTDGYRVVGPPRTTGDGYYESVVLDPEGNHIEITV